ncbi:MAG TPA: dephospho-CoA kinase [Desulfobacterales bacterium]|nr:dephospho-CoA kinase [Desulfobacterales bacterium]HIP40504.1 dephospho-CoA kinase [Desulfocapsa sulfexigens]
MNIAVTGGMGAGKSRVATVLAELLGAMKVSADSICRELLCPGNPAYLQIRDTFPADCFFEDGQLNRTYLRELIFRDKVQRTKLDDILHPMVRNELNLLKQAAHSTGVDLIAEVPLLYEKGWQSDFDCSLVVFADEEVCLNRIMSRDHVTREKARESFLSQMPLDEKCRLGDWVIGNSGSFTMTTKLIKQFSEKILAGSLCSLKSKEL